MDEKTILTIIVIAVILLVVFLYVRKNRCKVCGSFFTMTTTGKTYGEPFTKRESQYIPEKRTTRHYNVTYRNYTIHTKCSKCGNTDDIDGQELISRKTTF